MEDREYHHVLSVLKDKSISSINKKENQRLTTIRENYKLTDDKLKKMIAGKYREVPRRTQLVNVLRDNHDLKGHGSKNHLIKETSDYYWATKHIDIDIYLSKCNICKDKYPITDLKMARIKKSSVNKGDLISAFSKNTVTSDNSDTDGSENDSKSSKSKRNTKSISKTLKRKNIDSSDDDDDSSSSSEEEEVKKGGSKSISKKVKRKNIDSDDKSSSSEEDDDDKNNSKIDKVDHSEDEKKNSKTKPSSSKKKSSSNRNGKESNSSTSSKKQKKI